jgi:hypothetical protein
MSICYSVGTAFGELPDRLGLRFYKRLDCKRSACDHCGPIKARRYRRAIAREAEAHGLTRFLTLTLDPQISPGPDESVEYIRDCFNKFRTYYKREFGAGLQYVAVVELQRSGMAHLHLLINRFVPKAWLDDAWRAVGGGFTWIKYTDVHRVSAYISKYLTKDLFASVPSKKKRISTSRGIHLFEKRQPLGWIRDGRSLEWHYRRHAGLKRRLIADVVADDVGLKSFSLVTVRTDVFGGVMQFFENPYKALMQTYDHR